MTQISPFMRSFVGFPTSQPKRNKAIFTRHVKKRLQCYKIFSSPIRNQGDNTLCLSVLPQVWRKIIPQPRVVLGKVGVLRDPELDHVLLHVEVEEAEAAEADEEQGDRYRLPRVRGHPFSVSVAGKQRNIVFIIDEQRFSKL